jgi:phage anti-repressor protein
MNELIKVTEQNGKQAVSARELHQFLENSDNVNTWFKRQAERAMLVENEDFIAILQESTGGRPSIDYAITLSAAKEIAMLNGGEKGKQARQYFIECEKQLNKPKTQIELILQSAQLLAEMERKQLALENRIEAIEKRPEMNGEIQHFSIMGHCRNIGKQISLEEAKTYGQRCSRMCTQMGFQTGKIPDPRFGTVKTYPLTVLQDIIGG